MRRLLPLSKVIMRRDTRASFKAANSTANARCPIALEVTKWFSSEGNPKITVDCSIQQNRNSIGCGQSRLVSKERGEQARENSAREKAHGETSCDPLIFKRELLRNLQSDPAEVGSSAKTKRCVRGIAAEEGGRGGLWQRRLAERRERPTALLRYVHFGRARNPNVPHHPYGRASVAPYCQR